MSTFVGYKFTCDLCKVEAIAWREDSNVLNGTPYPAGWTCVQITAPAIRNYRMGELCAKCSENPAVMGRLLELPRLPHL